MRYQNKTIWITGASSGIGEALAQGFAKEGANLILSSRSIEKLNLVKVQCLEFGAKQVWVIPLDLAKYSEFPELVKKTIQQVGKIDILINNGGISQRSLATNTSLEVDRRVIEINYFGTIALTKSLLPHFIENNNGQFVVISSLVGKFGWFLRTAYSASKHALHGFFDSLRIELLDTNIKVTMICPGFIHTNISVNAMLGDGSTHGKMDDNQAQGMPADVFSQKAIRAIYQGKREVNIGGKEVMGVYIKRFLPALFYRMASKRKAT